MVTADPWPAYLAANARANRAYDTHMAELEHRARPLVERNRAKSRRYYAAQLAKKEARS